MIAAFALLLAALQPAQPSAADPLQVRTVPQQAGTSEYDAPNVAISDPSLPRDAPLVLFLPGTGGNPANSTAFLRFIAQLRYRVIGLNYPDVPAVVSVCPRDPDPDCSGNFRAMRVDGSGPGAPGVRNSPADSITGRLVHALRALEAEDPRGGWARYLDGDQPRWSRIVVSGLSQGAGMAAYIAKQHEVRRVVLFSSPWDFQGAAKTPARWFGQPSATPMNRWYAEYNRRERTADQLALSYPLLGIPADHVFVFGLDLPPRLATRSPNPYHGINIRDFGYAQQWQRLFGRGDEQAAPR
jgi:hypothetical protein